MNNNSIYDLINKNILKFMSFSKQELDLINSFWEYVEIPKKTLILKQGDIMQHEYFINKGVTRTFYIDSKGQEVNMSFCLEDWWLSDVISFHEKVPSLLYIQTLEDSKMLRITLESKEKLLKAIPILERFYRLLLQRHLSNTYKRLVKNISQNAKENYLDFIKTYPTLQLRISQHYIASYLGITPEFLSKTRKRMIIDN